MSRTTQSLRRTRWLPVKNPRHGGFRQQNPTRVPPSFDNTKRDDMDPDEGIGIEQACESTPQTGSEASQPRDKHDN